MNQRARPFWTAFFLTLCLLATAAALLTVDCRCRSMTSPTEEIPISFSFDSAADGEGALRFSWFGTGKEITLRPAAPFRKLLRTIPSLIPRPFRAAALLQLLPDLTEEISTTQKDGGVMPPSFYFSIFEMYRGRKNPT